MKTMSRSNVVIDMLSKTGIIENGVAIAHRQFLKSILSGNVTDKIREGFSVEEHRYAITMNLKAWGTYVPIVKEYIEYRENNLIHSKPCVTKMEKLIKPYVSHANSSLTADKTVILSRYLDRSLVKLLSDNMCS